MCISHRNVSDCCAGKFAIAKFTSRNWKIATVRIVVSCAGSAARPSKKAKISWWNLSGAQKKNWVQMRLE